MRFRLMVGELLVDAFGGLTQGTTMIGILRSTGTRDIIGKLDAMWMGEFVVCKDEACIMSIFACLGCIPVCVFEKRKSMQWLVSPRPFLLEPLHHIN